MIEILRRYTRAVLYSSATATNMAAAVAEARATGANLAGANLAGADLAGANLTLANLSGANLDKAVGLLPNGLVPLQIFGTRYPIIVRTPGIVQIGCLAHPLAWWRSHEARAVAAKEGYTPAQIAEYADHLDACERWMLRYGVAEKLKP